MFSISTLAVALLAAAMVHYLMPNEAVRERPVFHIARENDARSGREKAREDVSTSGIIKRDTNVTKMVDVAVQIPEKPMANINDALKLSTEKLNRCHMVTSNLQVTPKNVVFATPSLIVVQKVMQGSANLVQRTMAFRKPDGSCREISDMHLECMVNPGEVDRHCEEYSRVVGKGPCVAASPGVCSLKSPAMWTAPTIAAGVLPIGRAGSVSTATSMIASDPPKKKNVLVVGVAAGSIPGYLSQHMSNAKITAVDIDPDVVFAAQHFFLQGGSEDRPQGRQVNLELGDGLTKLKEQEDNSLAAIFMDAYDPNDEEPTGLYRESGLAIAKSKLQDGGRILIVVDVDYKFSKDHVSNTLKKLGFTYVAQENHAFCTLVAGVVGDAREAPSLVEDAPAEVMQELKKWRAMGSWVVV